jgi:6-pyruvoyltetrahydropterin/6-carboxytetrahydropterin synthase
MISITKSIKFSAAHWLNSPHLTPEENQQTYGKDNNPDRHGHNYVLEATVTGKVNPQTGIVMNLVELKQILMEEVYDKVDHRDLSADVPMLDGVIPTSENLTLVFWEKIKARLPENTALENVRLYETDSGWVTYSGK